MAPAWLASAGKRRGFGEESVNVTDRASLFSTAVMFESPSFVWSPASVCWSERTTELASSGVPSENVSPLRRKNV